MIAWQCETCGEVYPEYVNGCPKCWHGDGSQPEPEVRSKVVAVELVAHPWCGEKSPKTHDLCRRQPVHKGDHLSRLDRWRNEHLNATN